MIIGTNLTPRDASDALCTLPLEPDEPSGPFALPPAYVALMFGDLVPGETSRELTSA